MPKAILVELERNEFRAIKARAARQLRTPENLARFLILKQMGFILEEHQVDGTNNAHSSSGQVLRDQAVAV